MEDRINIDLPEKWNDLSKKQLLQVCRMFEKGLPESEFLSYLALKFSGLKMTEKKSAPGIHVLRKGCTQIVLDPFQFISIKETLRYLIGSPKLSKQLIPSITIRGKKYLGPQNGLINLTFGEWIQIDVYMQLYSKTKERKYLEMIAAAMYRPEKSKSEKKSLKYDGDPRRQFNEYRLEKDSRKFRFISFRKLLAITIFFNGCMEELKDKFPLTLHTSGSGSSRDIMKETLSMIDHLNNDDVTKNSAVQASKLYDVLTKLEVTRERAEKLKSKK